MSTDLSGQRLGEFELLELLGSGKFANVYRADWPARKRKVALKVFKDSLEFASKGTTVDLVRLARDEARRSFSLDHRNIVKGYGLYELSGHSVMVMDLVDGMTLYDLLAARRPFISDETIFDPALGSSQPADGDETIFDPCKGAEDLDTNRRPTKVVEGGRAAPPPLLNEVAPAAEAVSLDARRYPPFALGHVAAIANDLCEALAYAHEHGVIHRDLKPENIFIDWHGVTLLGDFGVALAQEVSSLMRTGMIVGTVHYMSPEQAKGLRQIDGRSDIYSLGVVLYHMLTGTLPFEGALLTVLEAHQRQAPERPSLRRGDISPALEQIVLACLAKEPKERYGSVRDVASAIKRVVKPLPLTDLPELVAHAGPKLRPLPHLPKRRLEDAAGYCPDCGSSLTADETASRCGLCRRVLKSGVAAGEARRLAADAAAFAASFKLDAVTDWGVLEWEYKRTVRPALEPKLQGAVTMWTELLDAGSIVPPQWGYTPRPRESRLLEAAKQLFNLTYLWDAAPVDRFLVHDDFVKERTRCTAQLRGQAYQLLGLHHCAVAAAGAKHADIVSSYTTARHCFGRAAEDLAIGASDISAAASFSAHLTQAILDYPDQPGAADAITVPVIPVKADGRQIPGLAADLLVLAAYHDADNRSRARLQAGEANVAGLLNQGNAAVAARETALQGLADRACAEQNRVEARCLEINETYRRDLGLFAGMGIAARIGVLAGPLLLLLLASFLLWTIKGDMPLVMAVILASGALGLPLGVGYWGGRFWGRSRADKYDLSPTCFGVFSLWALIAFILWYYGVTQPAATGFLTGKTIGWTSGVLVALVGLWAFIMWRVASGFGGRLWYAFVATIGLATAGLVVGYGIALSRWLPGHFLWLLGGAVLLAILGWAAAHTVTVIRNTRTLAQGRRSTLLRKLNAESETMLTAIERELTSQLGHCRNITQELTGQIASEIAGLEAEAQTLSARLLRRSAPGELTPLDVMRRNAADLGSMGADTEADRLTAIRLPISQARNRLAIEIRRLPVTAEEVTAAKATQVSLTEGDEEKVEDTQAEAALRRLLVWAAPSVVLLLGAVVWGFAGVHYIPRRAALPPPVTFWMSPRSGVSEPAALLSSAPRLVERTVRSARDWFTEGYHQVSRSPAIVRTIAWFTDTHHRISRSPAFIRASDWWEAAKARVGLAHAEPTPLPAPDMTATTATSTSEPTAAPTTASSPNTAASSEVLAIVNVNRANVRGGPGTNYPVVSGAITGTRTSVIGRNPAGDWWYVCCFGGKRAWLADLVVRIEGSSINIKAVPTVIAPAP